MITLGVNDLQISVAFYEKLGFVRKQPLSDEIAFFDLNGSSHGFLLGKIQSAQ